MELSFNFSLFCISVDGAFQEWTVWSECTVSCSGGTTSRTRECMGAEGEGQCHGASEESVVCNTDPCPSKCGESTCFVLGY